MEVIANPRPNFFRDSQPVNLFSLESAVSGHRVYLESARTKVHQIRLGHVESPTAEHLAHSIGYLLKSFSAHLVWNCADYAMKESRVPISPRYRTSCS